MILVQPRDVIIIECIFALENEILRNLMDVKLYDDTDSDIRILRRMQRDIEKRGRTMDSVINQYLTVVRPMHLQFIEPTKRFSDDIIPEGGENNVAIDLITTKIRTLINNYNSEKQITLWRNYDGYAKIISDDTEWL